MCTYRFHSYIQQKRDHGLTAAVPNSLPVHIRQSDWKFKKKFYQSQKMPFFVDSNA